MKNIILFSALLVFLSSANCKKDRSRQSAPPAAVGIEISILADGLLQPWELVWGPDNFLWMTERGGTVSRVNPADGKVQIVAEISEVVPRGEGGLLGMALHPDFATVPEVFVAYNYNRNGEYLEKVVKFRYSNSTLIDPVVLLDNIAANTIHNGCRLLISKDKKLIITTGDAGNQPLAQNLDSLNGKVLRLNLDGSVPADNPVSGSPVWTSGHRNAQGLVFANNRLYSSEHGPNSNDEFNVIAKSGNYGWPQVEGFCNEAAEQAFCLQNNVTEPLYAWTPTLAVSGIDYYNNDLIQQWKNSVLMATLKDNTLYQLQLNAAGDQVEKITEIFRGTYGRLRDVCVAPDGRVYVATGNGSDDKILVISKK